MGEESQGTMRNMSTKDLWGFQGKECPSNFYKKSSGDGPFKINRQVDLVIDIFKVGHIFY